MVVSSMNRCGYLAGGVTNSCNICNTPNTAIDTAATRFCAGVKRGGGAYIARTCR